jgi:hypothetical protein
MGDLMHQSRELLGGGQARKQRNVAAGRDTSCGCYVGGMDDCDGLPCQPDRQAFAETHDVALDLGQMRQVVSGGLADILSRDLWPSLCALDGCRRWMYFSIAVKRRWLLWRFTTS